MVRGSGGLSPGFSLIELLFSMAIAGTVTAMAVPQGLRALDDFRARSAARYLAQRALDARYSAIADGSIAGLRFAWSPDFGFVDPVDQRVVDTIAAAVPTF